MESGENFDALVTPRMAEKWLYFDILIAAQNEKNGKILMVSSVGKYEKMMKFWWFDHAKKW